MTLDEKVREPHARWMALALAQADLGARTAAEFEIAHLRLKAKKWADATARLDAIIARYETTGGAGIPPEYLVLAKNDRARIPAQKIK